MCVQIEGIDCTRDAVEFYDCYKKVFGKVTKAIMKREKNGDSILILENDRDEKLTFEHSLSAGYSGEGPRGTFKILTMSGFCVSWETIMNNTSFILTK